MNYKKFYSSNILHLPKGVQTIKSGKSEEGSRSFASAPNRKMDTLYNIFCDKADNKELFYSSFNAATGGKGLEIKRITTLHSSSLLGLLLFWEVSEEHPISISRTKYTKVFFEMESRVLGSNSSIDVLLVSEDKSTLLYLELKFTEILSPSKHYWVDEKYYRLYEELEQLGILNRIGLNFGSVEERKHKKDGEPAESTYEFKIELPNNERQYLGGIKQMISHSIGMAQGLAENYENELKDYIGGAEINDRILGTVIFDFGNKLDTFYSDNYKACYHKAFGDDTIIKTISSNQEFDIKHPEFKVLDEPLTYQQIVKDNPQFPFGDAVLDYYGLR